MLFKNPKNARTKNVTDIYLFCDRCAGQNYNQKVFVMLFLTLQWLGFESITLSFFITGHSQNENDSARALIERLKECTLIQQPNGNA